jgi:hypothetical protein
LVLLCFVPLVEIDLSWVVDFEIVDEGISSAAGGDRRREGLDESVER